jgi:surface protein
MDVPGGMLSGCESLHTLHLDNCDNYTLKMIINYGDLPTNRIDGVTKTIYCKKSQMSGVKIPTNWNVSYIYEEEPDVPLYESGQFKNKTAITNIETTVNESHTDLSYMLYNCTSLISVNTEDWDTSNVTDMSYMFYKCTKLTSLDLSNWSVRNVINMKFMFDHCGITTLDISNWLAYPESTAYMFQSCSNLTSLNTSGLRLYSMVNTKYMFANCSSLATLDLSGMSMSSVTDATNMFYNCTALTDFIAPKNIKVSIDFSNCTNLTYDSLVSIFNNLATVTSTQTITISRASFTKIMNDGCIAAAGDRGWSLSIN